MSIKVFMPALSPTMKAGKLVKWIVKKGDKVVFGDYIADIETDKAIMEMESMEEGVVSDMVPEGLSGIKVGDLIAVFIKEGEEFVTLKQVSQTQAAAPAPQAPAPQGPPGPQASAAAPQASQNRDTAGSESVAPKGTAPLQQDDMSPTANVFRDVTPKAMGGRVMITPIAKKMAHGRKIDILTVSGSGPSGRIRKADIESLTLGGGGSADNASNANNSSGTIVNMSAMQSVIAEKMLQSKSTVPHFYIEQQVDVDQMLLVKGSLSGTAKVSVNDLLIKACAMAIKQCPFVNLNYVDGSQMCKRSSVDIAFAVGVESGILTPRIECADKKSIWEIAKTTKQEIAKIKEGDYSSNTNDGSLTLSNLGMFGVDKFTSIINFPMPLSLAVGRAIKVPKVVNDEIRVAQVINFVLSVDHRVVNGMEAAKFLVKLKELVEDPILIFA